MPWRLPVDPDQEACSRGGGGGGDAGGAVFRNNICACNTAPVELGVEYDIEPGNMIGPTFQGVEELIALDPGARWVPGMYPDGSGGIQGSDPAYGVGGMNSPRVIKLAIFDPTEISGSGMQTIKFNNFALMFIEEQTSNRAPVMGRFLYFVSGEESAGPTTGSLVKYLRLVK